MTVNKNGGVHCEGKGEGGGGRVFVSISQPSSTMMITMMMMTSRAAKSNSTKNPWPVLLFRTYTHAYCTDDQRTMQRLAKSKRMQREKGEEGGFIASKKRGFSAQIKINEVGSHSKHVNI